MINDFTTTTDQLQEDIMMYVNEIGSIVHGLVYKYFG